MHLAIDQLPPTHRANARRPHLLCDVMVETEGALEMCAQGTMTLDTPKKIVKSFLRDSQERVNFW